MILTSVVLTRNEEKNIVGCLESIKWSNEIIVIDDNSEDRTVENAQKFGANVFKHSLDDDFSRQRNFGLSKAKGNWLLFVDADERVSDELKNEIIDLTTQSDRIRQLNAYFIKRTDFMWGKELKHGETGNIKLLRLAKKGCGKWKGKVHEKWLVRGKVGQLKNPLYHYPHQSMTEFLKKISYYTDLRVKELCEKKVKAQWWSIILYPKAKFIVNYFIKRGFLDGISGLIHALMMSFHSFLVRGKLWIWKGKEEK